MSGQNVSNQLLKDATANCGIYLLDTSGKTPCRSFSRDTVIYNQDMLQVSFLANHFYVTAIAYQNGIGMTDFKIRFTVHTDTRMGNLIDEDIALPLGVIPLEMMLTADNMTTVVLTVNTMTGTLVFIRRLNTALPKDANENRVSKVKRVTTVSSAHYILKNPANIWYLWFAESFCAPIQTSDPLHMMILFFHSLLSQSAMMVPLQQSAEYTLNVLTKTLRRINLPEHVKYQAIFDYCPLLTHHLAIPRSMAVKLENLLPVEEDLTPQTEDVQEFLLACLEYEEHNTFSLTSPLRAKMILEGDIDQIWPVVKDRLPGHPVVFPLWDGGDNRHLLYNMLLDVRVLEPRAAVEQIDDMKSSCVIS